MREKACKGWLYVVDDYGEHKYRVSKKENGCYYFMDKNLEGKKMRYNENKGEIEEITDKGDWDVFCSFIYQAQFVRNT